MSTKQKNPTRTRATRSGRPGRARAPDKKAKAPTGSAAEAFESQQQAAAPTTRSMPADNQEIQHFRRETRVQPRAYLGEIWLLVNILDLVMDIASKSGWWS